jgi:hypothetical protein
MAEIYKDQASRVITKIYWAGEITDADGTVTALVKRSNPDGAPFGQLPSASYTATKLDSDFGTYEIIIPQSASNFNEPTLEITWSYSVNGIQTTHKQIVDVVRPYVSISESLDRLNIGTDVSDPNYRSYNELKIAERYARKLIDAYTNQFFSEKYMTETQYGSGTDVLPLKTRIISLTVLKEEGITLIDSPSQINNWTFVPKISESNYGLSINKQDLYDNLVYTANGLIPPSINDRSYSGAFKKDYIYSITGWYGWNRVPDDVSEACLVLMQQYFEKDRAWKDKYVKNISTFDWKFEFLDKAHTGTGNLYADQLLDQYVVNGMVVI